MTITAFMNALQTKVKAEAWGNARIGKDGRLRIGSQCPITFLAGRTGTKISRRTRARLGLTWNQTNLIVDAADNNHPFRPVTIRWRKALATVIGVSL